MPPALSLLLVLALSAQAHAWPRPLWYQVGLDLQPWGCQPNALEGCEGALGCSGHWMGMSSHIYPVAGVTVTTTMMLLLSRAVLQRRRSQAAKGERHPAQVSPDPCGPWKRRGPVSDRTLLRGVLHMMDALLLHIEGHLQRTVEVLEKPVAFSGCPEPRPGFLPATQTLDSDPRTQCLRGAPSGHGGRSSHARNLGRRSSWEASRTLLPTGASRRGMDREQKGRTPSGDQRACRYPQPPPEASREPRRQNCACAADAAVPASRMRGAARH
ncbi:transmembrane protein 89 [Tenrec ecaudatus]|uniref:transmembrane protein 89 n=1 Tax=Tenrec ecaudatus TaxID=94439 RepID=UPI003F5A5BD1